MPHIFYEQESIALDPNGLSTIGRSDECTVTIDSSQVSGKHASILCQTKVCVLKQISDINPIKVNGLVVEEALLHDGDFIEVGGVELTFQFGDTKKGYTLDQKIDELQLRFDTLRGGPAMLAILNDDSGTIGFVSHKCIDMLGYRERELVGSSHGMLLPQRFLAQHMKLLRSLEITEEFRQMQAGRPITVETAVGPKQYTLAVHASIIPNVGRVHIAYLSSLELSTSDRLNAYLQKVKDNKLLTVAISAGVSLILGSIGKLFPALEGAIEVIKDLFSD